MLNTDVSAILTNGETQDVFRGGQGEAKLPCVVTDDLHMQHTHAHTGKEREVTWLHENSITK